MRRVLCLLALSVSGVAGAQDVSSLTETERLYGWSPKPGGGGYYRNAANPWVQSLYRTYGQGPGGARATTRASIPGPAGPLVVDAVTHLPRGAILNAAATAAKVLPWVAAGVAAWDLYDTVRVRPSPAGGGLSVDPGAGTVAQTQYCTERGYFSGRDGYPGGYASGCGATPHLAVAAHATYAATVAGISLRNVGPTGFEGFVGSGFWTWIPVSVGPPVVAQSCPASIDPFDPAFNVPEGLPPDPTDGRCKTARGHHQPISIPDAVARLEQYAPPAESRLPDIARDAIERGVGIQGTPQSVSGPSSQQGTPQVTTTTNPDGTTRTETKTPTYNYTYSPTTVNYTVTNVTTVNNAGDITTTVETVEPEPSEECKLNPQAIQCQELGEGTAEPLQRESIPVAPESVPFVSAAGCPTFPGFSIYGKAYTIDTTGFCDVAQQLRVIFLALGAASAAFIFMQGFRV